MALSEGGVVGGGVLKIQPRFRVEPYFQGVIKIRIKAQTTQVTLSKISAE